VYTATGQKAKPKVHLSTESTAQEHSTVSLLVLPINWEKRQLLDQALTYLAVSTICQMLTWHESAFMLFSIGAQDIRGHTQTVHVRLASLKLVVPCMRMQVRLL
jgi:hypothetical protein